MTRLDDAVRNNTREVLLSSIHIPAERLRKVTRKGIAKLAESIKENGQINAITVQPYTDDDNLAIEWRLIAGARRYKAIETLEQNTIRVYITNTNELEAKLIEIDENLQRLELNQIEYAEHISERVDLLRKLGIMRKGRGGDQLNADPSLRSVDEVADEMGISKRNYHKMMKIAGMSDAVRNILRDTRWSDRKTDLEALSRESGRVQFAVAKALEAGADSMPDAISEARTNLEPLPPIKAAPGVQVRTHTRRPPGTVDDSPHKADLRIPIEDYPINTSKEVTGASVWRGVVDFFNARNVSKWDELSELITINDAYITPKPKPSDVVEMGRRMAGAYAGMVQCRTFVATEEQEELWVWCGDNVPPLEIPAHVRDQRALIELISDQLQGGKDD